MSFMSCKIDCEGSHQCTLQWSYHSVKTDFPTLILLTLHFHTRVNRTLKLMSALLLDFWLRLWSEACIRTWMLPHSSFKHWSWLVLIHPVYSLHDSYGESNYFQLSSTLLLVTLRLLFISLELPRPRGFQSVQWVACTNIVPLCVGNRWVNTAQSLKHFPSLLLDYQLPFRVSSAQMSAKINGALSAKLIRSGLALLLLIRDYFFSRETKT